MEQVPDWKDFECAVAGFLKAIGTDAEVTKDVRIPDAHTGEPRQRDVWIKATLAGMFPITALVSCKKLGRVLHQQDIDHFNGEFISSKADIGVIYSIAGYNYLAIDKAKFLGFHCCRLFENQPAELPAILLTAIYLFKPSSQVGMRCDDSEFKYSKWRDVLELPVGCETVISLLAKALDKF